MTADMIVQAASPRHYLHRNQCAEFDQRLGVSAEIAETRNLRYTPLQETKSAVLRLWLRSGGVAVDTVNLAIELPRSALSALRQEPAGFAREMRITAAVKWYEMQLVSQAKAAEIAGLSRSEFVLTLHRFGVTPFQYGADEIIREVTGG